MPSFDEKIREINGDILRAKDIAILQVNVGYACNMSCKHCHLSAGPGRDELMSLETVEAVLGALRRNDIRTIDITGGAPELNPHLKTLIAGARSAGAQVIVRTNLTVLLEPGMEDFEEFYRDQGVEVVASLPHFTGTSVDRVRGAGTFEKCLTVLRRFNDLGYGKKETGLVLNLVYNPPGAILPGSQRDLESRYRKELIVQGIDFNSLFVLANMALGRFRDFLIRTQGLESYMASVRKAFNPGDGRGAHVPPCRECPLGRDTLRLRFQPGAGHRGGQRLSAAHCRLRCRAYGRPAGDGGRSLLRLHGRCRYDLPGRDCLTGGLPVTEVKS